MTNPLPGTFFLHTMWMFGCTKPTSEVTAVAQTSRCRYHLGPGIYNVQTAVEDGWQQTITFVAFVRAIGAPRPHSMSCRGRTPSVDPHNGTFLCCRNGRTCLGHAMCSDNGIAHQSARPVHSRTLWRRQVKIDGVLILALIEMDTTNSLKILFICKKNSGTRSFADLLLWLDPPSGVFGCIGRLVGDQEHNKNSYSHTKFDIHPRERR